MTSHRMLKACKEISSNCPKVNDIQSGNWKVSFIAYASYNLRDLGQAFEELVQNNDPYNTILLMMTF